MPSSNILKFSKKPRAILFEGKEVPLPLGKGEIEAVRKEGYDRGLAEAAASYEEKLVEYRNGICDLQKKTLEALESQHEALIAQAAHALPALTMEAIRRVLTIVQIDAETVAGIVDEMLEQTNPGSGALELRLSERDLKLFEGNEERLAQKYPGISFTADPELQPGDCVVRSRFGLIDGRVATKLQNMEGLLQ